KVLDYVPPFQPVVRNTEYRPPIWITMVGQSGEIVPIQTYPNYIDDDYIAPVQFERERGTEKGHLQYSGAAFVVLFLLVVGITFPQWCEWKDSWGEKTFLFWEPQSEHNARLASTRLYRVIVLGAVLVILCPVSVYGLTFLRDIPDRTDWYDWFRRGEAI